MNFDIEAPSPFHSGIGNSLRIFLLDFDFFTEIIQHESLGSLEIP